MKIKVRVNSQNFSLNISQLLNNLKKEVIAFIKVERSSLFFISGAWPVLIDEFVEYARPLIKGPKSTTV